MLKDLGWRSRQPHRPVASTPLGAEAAQLFSLFVNAGQCRQGLLRHHQDAGRQMITLYDLVFDKDLRPSPFCWRAKLALKHKGLSVARRALRLHREAEDRLRPVADLSGDP